MGFAGKLEMEDGFFLVEKDSSRVSALFLKNVNLAELHSALAFEDFPLKEGFPSLKEYLPKPRFSVYEELMGVVAGSWISIMVSYTVGVCLISTYIESRSRKKVYFVPAVASILFLTLSYSS